MDPLIRNEKIGIYLSKYKYVFLVVAAGICFMMIPTGEKDSAQDTVTSIAQSAPDIQAMLEEILQQIEGVGKVKVLLTQSEGERILYETNDNISDSEQSSSRRTDTVIISDASRTETGLVQQIIPPVYLGAIVVCQGGDKPSVKLAVVEAVANATGLSSDRISVLKMK